MRTESQIRMVIRKDLRWIVMLLGVVIIFLFFRWQVVEVFHIPSTSMEPLLTGDPESGDKVLVNKLGLRFSRPRRWEVVVFNRKGDTESLIKRLVGLPGETVWVEDGDLYVDGEIPSRRDAVLEEMLIPVFRTPSSPTDFQRVWSAEGSSWSIDEQGAILFGGGKGARSRLETRNDVTDSFVDEKNREIRGLSPVGDLRLSLEAVFLSATGKLEASIQRGVGDPFTVAVEASGDVRLAVGSNLLASFEAARTDVRPGRPFRVDLSTIDRRLRLRLNGVDMMQLREEVGPGDRVGFRRRNNRVELAVSDTQIRLKRLDLRRDIYYAAEGDLGIGAANRVRLGPGDCFLLGDNSRASQDSRFWDVPVKLGDLVGVALMVVWPPGRIRMLPG